jgi:hypothetical protein
MLPSELDDEEFEEAELFISADGSWIEHIDGPIATAITAQLGNVCFTRASDVEYERAAAGGTGGWTIRFKPWVGIPDPSDRFAPAERTNALAREVEILSNVLNQRELLPHGK